ncbi:MAG: hypothetical protein ACRDQ7_03200 [Haloechinothrix sp.]
MTWQEELRKLDEDFSDGKLSADAYRARRDQVLSSAVAPSQEPEQNGASPLPQGQGNSGGPSNAESTQKISTSSLPQAGQPPHAPGGSQDFSADAERTQAVPHWQAQQQHGPASPAAGFPQQYPPSPAAGFPQSQQPSWNAPEQDVSPPWGGSEFPPVAPSSESAWGITQGPETGDESESKGRTGKIVGIAVVVLLLAGLAFGGWWLWGRGDTSSATAGGADSGQTSAPGPEQTQAAPQQNENLPMAELGGRPEDKGEVTTFSDVPNLDYLTEAELAAYDDAGAGDAVFTSEWLSAGNKAVLLLVQSPDADDAKDAAEDLGDIQMSNGAKKAGNPPPGVYVTEFTNSETGLGQIRAHYASGDVLVRIEVANGSGISAARAAFREVLEAQLDLLPADA